jgi:eukaryotic-like serine/threonine-protein kinase
MAVQVQCQNPECRASLGPSEVGRLLVCPSCRWPIGSGSASGVAASEGGESTNDPLSAPEEFPGGGVLGQRYTILHRLGQGGMGVVYLAEDTRLERKVALKIPFPHLYQTDRVFLDRLYREARLAAAFHDSRICSIHDIDSSGGWHYIVMQYVEGKTLGQLLDKGPFDPDDALGLIGKVAEALQKAHDRNIIHRDLKPANVMLGPGREPIIMDFGLAKRLTVEVDTHLRSESGKFQGTLSYAPPEQVEGRIAEIGPASDIYALGVILYELLTGRLPFRGSRWEVEDHILNTIPDPPSTHAPAIPSRLDAIVLKALEKRPEDRFASMTMFAAALVESRVQATPEPPVHEPKPTLTTDRPATSVIDSSAGVSIVELPPRRRSFEKSSGHSTAPRDATAGPKLIVVEPGVFAMGATDGKADERPVRKVTLTRPFSLGRFPVTQEEYERVTGRNPSYFRGKPRNPVEQVSWFDAVGYCNELSMGEGLRPFYVVHDVGKIVRVPDYDGPGYRLPTEAEWEYACRAGRTSRFGCGDDELKLRAHAWFAANAEARTHAVGGKSPNRWGLFDMHGNVAEWCFDWYDPLYYKKGDDADPHGPDLARRFRAVRGGNWGDPPTALRASNRFWSEPSIRLRNIGFRVARTTE